MDDILDPADHEELGQRVEESEFATALLHRSRDVIRRLRLGAPQLNDDNSLDSNTVAEYLDNTLPPEQVIDFERVCLESDLHLAEVVSCHQILTLVLGEPAEIDEKLRGRMHQIVRPVEAIESQPMASPAIPDELAVESTFSDRASARPRDKPEIPDYLRAASRSRAQRAAVVVAAIAAAAVAAAAWVWWPNPDDSVARRPVQIQETPPPLTGSPNGAETNLLDPATDLPSATPNGVGDPAAFPPPAPANDEPLQYPAGMTPADATETAPFPVGPQNGDTADPATPSAPFPDGSTAAPEADTVPLEGFPPLSPDPLQENPAAASARAAVYSGAGTEVLLRFDAARGAWYRLPTGASIARGDRLLALPTFRPSLTLSSLVTLHLAGGSQIGFVDDSETPIPTVELVHGRVVLLNTGVSGSRVRLILGGRLCEIAFGDDPATVGVELRRELAPGDDPQSAMAQVRVDVYAADGSFLWRADGEAVDVQAPLAWRLAADPAEGAPAAEIPPWLATEQVTDLEARARVPLAQGLDFATNPDTARSVNLSLSELVGSRRLEVRSLAAESSIYIGEFGPFIRALGDVDQRSYWSEHIATLRQALALGPDVAAQIQQAFVRESTQDAEILYRMVWGYNREQLQQGALKELIDLLEHERLEVRVLAFENLSVITGKRLNYFPSDSIMERQASIRTWRERLDRGELEVVFPPPAPPAPAATE
jgi:hypothetical protein